jgi:hypothetical protein
MKNLILTFAVLTLLVAACTTDPTKKSTQASSDSTASSSEAIESPTAIDPLLNPYFKLKNALTQDNDKVAAEAGNELLSALESFDKSSLNSEQSKVYNDIYEDAKGHAEHIGANSGNIKHQREHFETLSQEIYEFAKSVRGKKLYYANCPMYNNNKGGNWLSEVREIRNPYFGSEMLECGTVKEELN